MTSSRATGSSRGAPGGRRGRTAWSRALGQYLVHSQRCRSRHAALPRLSLTSRVASEGAAPLSIRAGVTADDSGPAGGPLSCRGGRVSRPTALCRRHGRRAEALEPRSDVGDFLALVLGPAHGQRVEDCGWVAPRVGVAGCCVAHRLPDPPWSARHVDVPDAEVTERVDDRVVHRGRGAERRRLADALRARAG